MVWGYSFPSCDDDCTRACKYQENNDRIIVVSNGISGVYYHAKELKFMVAVLVASAVRYKVLFTYLFKRRFERMLNCTFNRNSSLLLKAGASCLNCMQFHLYSWRLVYARTHKSRGAIDWRWRAVWVQCPFVLSSVWISSLWSKVLTSKRWCHRLIGFIDLMIIGDINFLLKC